MTHPRNNPTRCCLKVEKWPKVDRDLWFKARSPGSIVYGGVGLMAHLRTDSAEKVRKGYGRWLTFLTFHRGEILTDSPGRRIIPELVAIYIDELRRQVAPWTVRARIAELFTAALVMAPEYELSWLREVAGRLERDARDAKQKQPRMRSAAEIYDWALSTLTNVRSVHEPGRSHAVRFRDALIVAVGITTLVRRRNLTMIIIGKHLVCRGDHFVLQFEPSETKNHEMLVAPLPDELTSLVELFIEKYRPILATPSSGDYLWLSMTGQPMSHMQMYHRVTKVTHRAFGAPINPHLFRDCGASTVATEFPEEVGIVTGMLGHVDPTTAQKHYIQANSLTASRRLTASIEQLRRELPLSPDAWRRRRHTLSRP